MSRFAATATVAPPLVLPADVRLMQATAQLVLVLAVLALLTVFTVWMARQPMFALRAIRIEGDVARNSVSTIRANAAPKLAGSFFTVDLARARAAFESVPWVRHAVVRRVWPDRLAVQLEEHRPVARWGAEDGNERLVNSFGEVFEANTADVDEDGLPLLSGPEGSAPQLLAMVRRLQPVLARINQGDLEELALSGRGGWRATLDKGAVIELGRGSEDEVVARTERFVRTLPRATVQYQRPLEQADLRHVDGYALRLRGVVTTAAPSAPRRK
ncbi:MAG: FtsQ-type POTRA domain-containing protein [Burkholderiales bacterium]|nr:FtsQ-type POTRA domain-containing protein [Burkholderiales bacterium]